MIIIPIPIKIENADSGDVILCLIVLFCIIIYVIIYEVIDKLRNKRR